MTVGEKSKSLVSKVPYPVRAFARWGAEQPREVQRSLHQAWDRYRIVAAGRKGEPVNIGDFQVRVNADGLVPFDLYEDIFLNRVYDFDAQRSDPRVIDAGSNIGMSILYFKQCYPDARIIGFEPDPTIMPYLRENIDRNNLTNVEVINAALAAEPGTITLNSDGGASTHVASYHADDNKTWQEFEVQTVQLSDYLDEAVDFMKMNIEGAEYEVLLEAEPKLRQIREMNIEYHRLPGVPCTLHQILDLLHRNGFMYVVSDFGLAMYGSTRPPARVDPDARFWRQVYACRVGDETGGLSQRVSGADALSR